MSSTDRPHRFSELSDDDLRILKERAKTAAKFMAPEVATERVEVLQISSRGQIYALPLSVVEGVAELGSIAYLPRVPSFVRGIVSFRGEGMLAIELSLLVGNVQVGFGDLRRIVSVSTQKRKLAVLAERAMTVRSISMGDFTSDPLAQSNFVVGTDSNFVSLLDPAALIEHAFKVLVT